MSNNKNNNKKSKNIQTKNNYKKIKTNKVEVKSNNKEKNIKVNNQIETKIIDKNILIFILFIIIIIVAILNFIFIKKDDSNKILGSFATGNTVYTFEKNNKGVMKLPLGDYKFTYKIMDNKLLIDFEDEKAVDPTYEYSLKDNILTIKDNRGTFKLTRK